MRRTLAAIALWVAAVAWPCRATAAGAEPASPVARPLDKWALTVYGGIGSDSGIDRVFTFQAHLEDAYMLDVGCSREVARWGDQVALEVEGQVAQHFKKQDHCEGNLLLSVRWMEFPWNDCVRTGVAVGEGISYASSVPTIERERSPGKTSRLLNYMMSELELAPPKQSRWSIVMRIHHRSGVGGLFNGVTMGSNILGVGMKYRF